MTGIIDEVSYLNLLYFSSKWYYANENMTNILL